MLEMPCSADGVDLHFLHVTATHQFPNVDADRGISDTVMRDEILETDRGLGAAVPRLRRPLSVRQVA